MTNKRSGSGAADPSDDNRIGNGQAAIRGLVHWEFRNGIVPEWEWLLIWAWVEDFVQLAGWRSSILGIAGLGVMPLELRFR
jgi:hypothetical protein